MYASSRSQSPDPMAYYERLDKQFHNLTRAQIMGVIAEVECFDHASRSLCHAVAVSYFAGVTQATVRRWRRSKDYLVALEKRLPRDKSEARSLVLRDGSLALVWPDGHQERQHEGLA
jgi:hypothetical protein